MTRLRASSIQSILTLSAGTELLLEPDRIVAARLEDLLELADRARVRGYARLHREYTRRIVDEVWRCPDGLNGPGGHAA